MLTGTSSAWFTSQPEYNMIQILDDDTLEPEDSTTREQAIDLSGYSQEYSIDDEKDQNSVEEIVHDTVSLIDTVALARNLETVVEIHEEDKQRGRTIAAATTRKSAKFRYFSTSSSDDDDIATLQDVEEETVETIEQQNRRSLLASIEKKLKKTYYIPPIADDAYRQLNGNRGRVQDRDPDFIDPMSTLSRAGHTLPKNQRDTSKRIILTKEAREQIRKNRIPKERPRRDPTQEKPAPVYTKRTTIPDRTPEFCKRPKVVHERKPPPPPPEPLPMTRTEEKRRQIAEMHSARMAIQTPENKPIPNRAPKCARKPEDYTRDRIKEIVRQKYKLGDRQIESTQEVESELGDTETVNEFPVDRKSRKQRLLEVLDENSDVEEWEAPVVEKYGISEPSSDFNDENDFTIAEDLLTDTEEGLELIRPKPVYYDPHETRAVKLRNQAVKQKLALREMKKRMEEEDEDERQWKRKKVGKEVAPALKQLEAMSTFRKEDIDEKRRRKNADNMNRAVAPLCSAIRSAENTDFMVKRETRIVQRQSDRNGRRHEERERQAREEEEKRKIRGQRKKKVMDLWKS